MEQTVLISLAPHESMLLRAAALALRAEGVLPTSKASMTSYMSGVDANPVVRESVETVLNEAAKFSSGIWSMHFENMAERIRGFQPPESDACIVSAPLGYEPDPSKTMTAITRDYAYEDSRSLDDLSESWREGLFKGRLWKSSTEHLLNSVYLPRFESVQMQAGLMTVGAVDVYTRVLRSNVDVLSAFSLMRDWRGRPNKSFLKLTRCAALIHGMHLFNLSLGRLCWDAFKGSTSHAAKALMGDKVGEAKLNEWAFVHRKKGFYSPKFHGELALAMLGSAEENFLRMEKERDVGGCLEVIQYLRDQVQLSETDYIAQHARFQLIADVARRVSAITDDEAVVMTMDEWRAEADGFREGLENDLSPFPRDSWRRKKPAGKTVEHISSASGWRGPRDYDDDPPPAA